MAEKITKEELEIIREWLPEGAKENIALKFGLAVSTVEQILINPSRFKKSVIDYSLELVEEHQREIQAMRDKIKAIA